MNNLDVIILLAYLGGLLMLGAILSRRIKNSEDMFAAGGQSPWWMAGISGYMTMFSSGTFVVWGGIAFRQGVVGISILVMLGIAALLVGFFLAKKWKQTGVTTAAEYIEMRYGKAAVQLYSWFGMFVRMVGVGVALYSISVILSALILLPEGNFFKSSTSDTLAVHWAVLLCGTVVVIYTIAGGMWAVLMADVLQFVVLTISVLIVVPLILGEVGGFSSFASKAPEGFFIPYSNEFPPLFLIGWIIVHFFKIGGEWAFVQRFLCVPNEKHAQKAAFIFGMLFLISPFLWMLPPMVYQVIDATADPKQAYILACQLVLPPGMIGFLMASMFAATASMADSEINVFAGAFTREIYGRIFHKNSTEKHLVFVGRIFTLILGSVVVGVALAIPYLGGVEKVILQITGMLVAPLVLPTIWGLFSKKIGKRAVWYTLAMSLLSIIVFKGVLGEADWVVDNARMVETCIIGIAVPLLTLIFLELTSQGQDLGYDRVQLSVADSTEHLQSQKASTMPQKILCGYILVIGVAIGLIGAFNEQQRSVLLITAGLLLAVSLLIFLLTKKYQVND